MGVHVSLGECKPYILPCITPCSRRLNYGSDLPARGRGPLPGPPEPKASNFPGLSGLGFMGLGLRNKGFRV